MNIGNIENIKKFEELVSELKNVDTFTYENREYNDLLNSIKENADFKVIENQINDFIKIISSKYYMKGFRSGLDLSQNINVSRNSTLELNYD